MATLVDRPHLYPGRCYFCVHLKEEFGPYLDTEKFAGNSQDRVYFCKHCLTDFLRGVDKVPRDQLLEAIKARDAKDAYIAQLEEQHRSDQAALAAQANQLEAAQVAKVNAEYILAACQKQLQQKKQVSFAERRASLEAELAEPALNTVPEKKPRSRKVTT